MHRQINGEQSSMPALLSPPSYLLHYMAAALGHRVAFRLLLLTCVCILTHCASVPDVPIDQLSGPAASPASTIMGARGPLTLRQSKTLLDRVESEAGDAGMLDRHLAIEQAVAESPLVAGNRTKI